MVSSTHRFLRTLVPDSPGVDRTWVLHGPGLRDDFFHDLYHGCVKLRRSLELWGLTEWSVSEGEDPPITVTLNTHGELDFSGNLHPADAQARFDRMRQVRPPRYGQQRSRLRSAQGGDAREASFPPDVLNPASQAAAGNVAESIGEGNGLVNRMGQIAAALQAPGSGRLLVIAEDLASQIQELHTLQQETAALRAKKVLLEHWIPNISQTQALVILIDLSNGMTDLIRRESTPGIRWSEIAGPQKNEIAETLRRVSRRCSFNIHNVEAIAASLEDEGDLKTAIGTVARVHKQGTSVSLAAVLDLPPVDEKGVEAALAELDALVGLQNVKDKARELRASATLRRRRLMEDGKFPAESMHLVFDGPPGTGKTSVARIFSRLYHALGLLPRADVTEKIAAEIMSEFTGATRTNMQRVLESAVGGVLFLDEVQHFADADDSRAKEALQALVPGAWNMRNRLVIILAGYSEDLYRFFEMDQGLPRRFPEQGRITFDEFRPDELWEILQRHLDSSGFELDADCEAPLRKLLERRRSRPNFGNAGGVENLVNELINRHDNSADSEDQIITLAELPPLVQRRSEYAELARERLEKMVGVDDIVEEIRQIGIDIEYAETSGEEPLAIPGFRFVGPPGTGKTTVARTIAEMLYGIGAIERNTVIEAAGPALRGAYLGQTAPKVIEVFRKAEGGVLFIDEAYGIQTDERDSFGTDAVNTILHEMTLPRNSGTVAIIAGYKPEIDRFIALNPGLSRRFSREVRFQHLSVDDCVEVARRRLVAQRLTAEDGFLESFALAAEHARTELGPQFGNAAWVLAAVETAFRRMRGRVVAAKGTLTAAQGRLLKIEDLRDLIQSQE